MFVTGSEFSVEPSMTFPVSLYLDQSMVQLLLGLISSLNLQLYPVCHRQLEDLKPKSGQAFSTMIILTSEEGYTKSK